MVEEWIEDIERLQILRHTDLQSQNSIKSRLRAEFLSRAEEFGRRHPLGFIYMSLPVSGGLCLRFHLWPEVSSANNVFRSGELHDHTYSLTSLIVAGQLRQRTFVATLGDDFSEYKVTYRESRSQLDPTGRRTQLVVQTDQLFNQGMCYHLEAGSVHCVEAKGTPLATAVLTKPKLNTEPRVFLPDGAEINLAYERRLLTLEELGLLEASLSKI